MGVLYSLYDSYMIIVPARTQNRDHRLDRALPTNRFVPETSIFVVLFLHSLCMTKDWPSFHSQARFSIAVAGDGRSSLGLALAALLRTA